MKSKFLAIAVLAIIVGFVSCKKEKSNKCEIESFSTPATPATPPNNPARTWTVAHPSGSTSGTITTLPFPKGGDALTMVPTVTVSKDATIEFSVNGTTFSSFTSGQTSVNLTSPVHFRVTAQDGKTTKTYIATATAL